MNCILIVTEYALTPASGEMLEEKTNEALAALRRYTAIQQQQQQDCRYGKLLLGLRGLKDLSFQDSKLSAIFNNIMRSLLTESDNCN